MKSKPQVLTWQDPGALNIAAAHFFVLECHRCIAERNRFIVALSGGNTPAGFYQLLATPPFSKNIPWDKVFFFWSDERFVVHTDPDSNYRMAKEKLLDHIPVPPENIFPVPVLATAKKSAAEYENTVVDFLGKKNRFDWMLLGVGNDGHTASLFPDTQVLKENKRSVKEVWAEDKKSWRISFTLPLINKAASVIFLVSGEEKATVVATVLNASSTKPLLPAQRVRPRKGILYWMLDEAAAAKI